MGVLGSVVNAQVAGAATGGALGPAAAAGQSVQSVGQMIVSAINGLMGSIGSLLPGGGGSGDASGAGAGAANGTSSNTAGSTGSALGLAGDLASAQSGGASIGDALGTASTAGAAVPSSQVEVLLNGPMGPLGSQATTLPNVGGILFEHCDAQLSDIGELTGAYWDSQTGSLVLVSRKGPEGILMATGLPAMDRDHLTVALRAAVAGEPIGVSIDPPKEFREGSRRGEMVPNHTPMLVSYLGGTEGTLFGAIMFEADRLMKCLDKGVDNVTGRPLRTTVPGFRTLLEMPTACERATEATWHRFWFVIDTAELRHTPESDALVFGDVRLKVLTETELGGQVANDSDSGAKAFAHHLTEHYDEYAKEFPVLVRLKELAKITAIAKFLVNRNVPLDLGDLFRTPPRPVCTPPTTPSILVSTTEGNVTRMLCGGVDMDAPAKLSRDTSGHARRLKEMAQSGRPSNTVHAWTFSDSGHNPKAIAIGLGTRQSALSRTCDDHIFDPNGLLRIRRLYTGRAIDNDFGQGWLLWVPFSISVRTPSEKRAEVLTQREKTRDASSPLLVLHDHLSGQSNIYRFAAPSTSGQSQGAFYRVMSQEIKADGMSFTYSPTDYICRDREGFVLHHDGKQYRFDFSGHLIMACSKDGSVVYKWKDGRVVRMSDDRGRSYEICRGRMVDAVLQIVASDNVVLNYSYDRQECLRQYRREQQVIETYRYDLLKRLVEVLDHNGKMTAKGLYDGLDRITRGQDTVLTQTGGKLSRQVENGCVTSVKDQSGTVAHYQYTSDGYVRDIDICHPTGSHWRLEYDFRGRLCGFKDCSGRRTQLFYDADGNVKWVQNELGTSETFQWNDNGRLVGGKDRSGRTWSADYDSTGRPTRLSIGQQQWTCRRGDSQLELSGPTGSVEATIGKDRATWRAEASDGTWRECLYHRQPLSGGALRLAECRMKGMHALSFAYDEESNIRQVVSERSHVDYLVDEKNLTVSIAFRAP